MKIQEIYNIGKVIPIGINIKSDEEDLKDIYYPYSTKEITATTFLMLIITIFSHYFFKLINPTLGTVIFFFGLIITIITYVYPTKIYYSKIIMEYQEEMFKAILAISNYVSMKTSLEYSFFHSAKTIKGVLKLEFTKIVNNLQRKKYNSLGEAIEPYIKKWNKVNPTFVKSLRLLQTAIMAENKDSIEIIEETIQTLMLNYKIQGKRSSEDLAQKAKGLISFGVLLPVMSLMLLPLLSVFMGNLVKPGAIFFIYDILFPTIMLLIALSFANKRIQIDTIKLDESPNYKKIPIWVYILATSIIIVFFIPGIQHLTKIDMASKTAAIREYNFYSIFSIWLIIFGIGIAIYFVTSLYISYHEKDWNNVKEAEEDMPHLLQILGTYLSLNISIENILPNISKDYKEQGFLNHPIVKIFDSLSKKILTLKGNVNDLMTRTLKKICPSQKVSNMLHQILTFSLISQKSATKSCKLIRNQTIATIELNDYIRTLLAETTALINISITMLLPLLSAIAIIMSILIVKSIDFISKELSSIQSAFGGQMGSLNLIDITQIIPPTVIETIVIVYFLEMFFILSLFASKIEIGNDSFKFAKKLKSNLMGLLIFSIILIGGHFLLIELFFKGMLK